MSLICSECEASLSPSYRFPEHNAVLLYPQILGLVYVPYEDPKIPPSYTMQYVPTEVNRSLCFNCLDRSATKDELKNLEKLYSILTAEVKYLDISELEKGRFIPVGESQSERYYDLYNSLLDGLVEPLLGTSPLGEGLPYFLAKPLDPVTSATNRSGTYGITHGHLHTLQTKFVIQYDVLQERFPRVHRMLSAELGGAPFTKDLKPTSSLYMSPEFVEAIEKQTGRSVDEVIAEGIKVKGPLNIIREIRNQDS